MSAARPKELETSIVGISVRTLIWTLVIVAGAAISWTAWSVNKLNSIETRITSLQTALPSTWTVNDQERQMNWLRQDNAGLKVREARDVVLARNP